MDGVAVSPVHDKGGGQNAPGQGPEFPAQAGNDSGPVPRQTQKPDPGNAPWISGLLLPWEPPLGGPVKLIW